jgi:hypothetical protein
MCGFTPVLRQTFNQSLMSELRIDAERRASERLSVEAVKVPREHRSMNAGVRGGRGETDC